MAWSETSCMEQRARFVLDALQGVFTMTELCYRYGVSRKTGYKWINRYHDNGVPGCGDRSRAPRVHPNATDPKLAARIVKLRRKHPGWGRSLFMLCCASSIHTRHGRVPARSVKS